MRQWLIGGIAALLLALSGPGAHSQQTFGITPSNTSTQSMSVTSSSSSITLDTKTGSTVVIANTGSNTAYITNTATATTTGFPIIAGGLVAFNFQPGSVISAITASSTTTLLVGKGSGATAFAGGGSGGGGGGSVTQGTTPWLVDCDTIGNTLCGLIGGAIPAGTNVIGALVPNQSVNIAQIAGTATATGSGAMNAGTQRTALATDSPGIITLGPAADTSSVPMVQSPTSSSTAAVGHASTTALGTSLVAKASAGNLYGYNCTGIAGAAAGYCIAYNGTAAPSTGALTGSLVLDSCYIDTTARGCSLSRIPFGANYSAGLVILITSATTPYTYTTGTLTGMITADYK